MRTYDSKDLTDPVRSSADRMARWLYGKANAADRYLKEHGLDRVFAHQVYLAGDAPPVHVAPSNELREPYRYSDSLVIRLPFTRRGLVIGIWGDDVRTEADGLLSAIRPGRAPDDKELENYDESLATQRESAFGQGLSPEGGGEGGEGGPGVRVPPAGPTEPADGYRVIM